VTGVPRSRGTAGFTLIELMIVIGLISILGAILVPSFQRARGEANLRACGENLRHLATVVAMYQTDNHGLLPNEPQVPVGSNMARWMTTSDAYFRRYLSRTPTCPLSGGSGYSYLYSVYNVGGKPSFIVFCYKSPSLHSEMGCPAYYPRYAVGYPYHPSGLLLKP